MLQCEAVKAYQRLIRERAGVTADFGLDIRAARVRPIFYDDAKTNIEAHEYLGNMQANTRRCYGLFFGERLAGVVVYATETSENLGVWDRYGYTGRIITLAAAHACRGRIHMRRASSFAVR